MREIKWIMRDYKQVNKIDIIKLMLKDIKLRKSEAIFNENFWDWKYKDNYSGYFPNWIKLAVSKEKKEIVGHYTMIPIFLKNNGIKQIAAQSVDTLTDYDYRGQGIFTSLAKASYKASINDGIDIVYGYPNDASFPGFVFKLDWKHIFTIYELVYIHNINKIIDIKGKNNFFVRLFGKIVLRLKSFKNKKVLKKIKGEYKVEEIKTINKELTDMISKNLKRYKYQIDRSIEYLKWRYLANPIDKNIFIRIVRKQNTILGVYILKIKKYPHRDNLNICHIMELISIPDNIDLLQFIIKDIITFCNKKSIDIFHIYSHVTQHDYNTLKKIGFMKYDEKKYILRINQNEEKYSDITEEKNWYISLGDSDRA